MVPLEAVGIDSVDLGIWEHNPPLRRGHGMDASMQLSASVSKKRRCAWRKGIEVKSFQAYVRRREVGTPTERG
jgi:hypothetical protein